MTNALMLSIPDGSFPEIPKDRYLDIHAKAQDHDGWVGIDYLVLCTQQSPAWIARIESIAVSRVEADRLRFSISEISSVVGKVAHADYPMVFKQYRHNGSYYKMIDLAAEVFMIGDPIPFIAKPETLGPLSMQRAIEQLAVTYGVEPDQVEVTIKSRAKQ